MAATKRQAGSRPTPSAKRGRAQPGATDGQGARGHQHPELIGLGLVALAIFLGIVLWLGWDGGLVGAQAATVTRTLVGGAAVLLPLLFGAVGGLMLARSALIDVRPFRTGLAVLCLSLLLAFAGDRFGLGDGSAPTTFDLDAMEEHGGIGGGALYIVSSKLTGEIGVTILAVTGTIAGLLLVTGASAGALLRRSAKAGRHVARHTARAARSSVSAARSLSIPAAPPSQGAGAVARPRPPLDVVAEYPDEVSTSSGGERDVPAILVDQFAPLGLEPSAETTLTGYETEEDAVTHEGEQGALFGPVRTTAPYRLPDRGLLRRARPGGGQPARAAERTAETLVQTLANFGIDATVIGQVSGPRVTRYELQLAPGTKVSRVSALKDDLAYALATTEIRILAPIPGKQAVGVEVPNLSPNLVTLGDIFDDVPKNASPLAVWLGKEISGQAVSTDLARMPHILIAGTTGSGKSGCINTMLCSILMRATPDDVRMILIDPKRVELSFYESIPHLLTPVVSSPKRAAAVLHNVVEEMERRYERMSIARSRNLPEFNRALAKRGEDTLPYLLVVIDELADLMMISPQDVEEAIIRLAQKSRAVGIHLVLATQRPSVDVITGMIKANVPSRIAFAVSSQTDSRVILDASGAEALLGQGDMLFKPLGTSRLQRIQGAYVSEEEIALIVEQCRGQRAQELDESLLATPPSALSDEDEDALDPDEDPLLDRAIEIVVQTQTASVSLIQRRMRVGYTRAGRLVDMLERRGIISGYEGSKPRRVLVGEADLERVLTAPREEIVG